MPAPHRGTDRGRAARSDAATLLRGRSRCRPPGRGEGTGDRRLFWIKIGEKVQLNRQFVEDHQVFGNLAMGGASGNYPQGVVAQSVDSAGERRRHDCRRRARCRSSGIQRHDAPVPPRGAAAAAQRALPFAAQCARTCRRIWFMRQHWPSSAAARIRSCCPTRRSLRDCNRAAIAWAMARVRPHRLR